MKSGISVVFAFILVGSGLRAQTTAMDFTMNDCNGNMHNLFSHLDSEKVVIMEFFHTCPSCVSAANDIQPIYQKLTAYYGDKIRFFASPEDDTYPCSSVLNWVNSNGFTSMITPFDSGGVQTAYYGGMGMPTIAIAAGSTHKIIYLANQSVGYVPSDTAMIEAVIQNFLDSAYAGVQNINSNVSIALFPNPVSNNFQVILESKEAGLLTLELTNISGQKIIDLALEKIQAGSWSRSFPISVPSGVYFINGSLNGKVFREKITVRR